MHKKQKWTKICWRTPYYLNVFDFNPAVTLYYARQCSVIHHAKATIGVGQTNDYFYVSDTRRYFAVLLLNQKRSTPEFPMLFSIYFLSKYYFTKF